MIVNISDVGELVESFPNDADLGKQIRILVSSTRSANEPIYKRVIIVGHGAAGKDHLRQLLVNEKLKPSISCTTRPPRDGEVDGQDYYFIGDHGFNNLVETGQFIEYDEFIGWKYGTLMTEFENSQVMIMTVNGVKALLKNHPELRESSVIVYINIDPVTRLQRLIKRVGMEDSPERRLAADDEDFKGFTAFDYLIETPEFGRLDVTQILQLIKN